MLLGLGRSIIRGVPRHGFRLVVLLITLMVVACADEGPTVPEDEGYRSIRTIGRSAVDPSSEMLAIGCTVTSAVASPTAVRLIPHVGKPDVFDCAGVATDSVEVGVRRYLDALLAADGDASLMAGEWTFTSREFC